MNCNKDKLAFYLDKDDLFVDCSILKANKTGDFKQYYVYCENNCGVNFFLEKGLMNKSQTIFFVNFDAGNVPVINFINHTTKVKAISKIYDADAGTTTLKVDLGLLSDAYMHVVLRGNVYNLTPGMTTSFSTPIDAGYSPGASASETIVGNVSQLSLSKDGQIYLDTKNFSVPLLRRIHDFGITTDHRFGVTFSMQQRALRSNTYNFNISTHEPKASSLRFFNTTGKTKTVTGGYDAFSDKTTITTRLGILSKGEINFTYRGNVFGLVAGQNAQIVLSSGEGYVFTMP